MLSSGGTRHHDRGAQAVDRIGLARHRDHAPHATAGHARARVQHVVVTAAVAHKAALVVAGRGHAGVAHLHRVDQPLGRSRVADAHAPVLPQELSARQHITAAVDHGVTHTVGSKREHAHAQHQRAVESGEIDASSTPAAGSEDIELLKVAVTGSNPMGFDIAHLPAASRFDKFTAVPMKALSNGIKTIYVFSLVAASGQTAVVAPPQFYKDGITAVLLDGDVVDANHTPLLYVVKESNDE